MGLDPFEGAMYQALSLNRYAYVQGNVINRSDPSGLFGCYRESPNIAAACEEFDRAISRSQKAGLVLVGLTGTDIEYDTRRDYLPLRSLETNAEDIFGIRLGVYRSQTPNDPEPECSTVPKQFLETVKLSTMRTVTALVHIVSKMKEDNISSNSVQDFRRAIGKGTLSIQLNATNIPNDEGYVPLRLTPESEQVYFGSNIPTYAIVHEIGHAIDRRFTYGLSNGLQDLKVRLSTGQALYNNLDEQGNVIFQDAQLTVARGLSGRANTGVEYEEIWADTFMTWVLDSYGFRSTNPDSNLNIQWNCSGASRHANLKNAYTRAMLKSLLQRQQIPDVDMINSELQVGNLPCTVANS